MTKRYTPDTESGEFHCATEDPEGEFVAFSKYVILAEAMKAAISDYEAEHPSQAKRILTHALREAGEDQ